MPSILSRPIRIGRMELKNRMVMAPMGVTVGNLSPASVAYFAARAEGGAAMVFCNIRASLAFESGEHSIYLNDETEPLFRGLAERCHACGCKLAAQIQPGDGRIGGPSVRYKVPISASACPWMHVPRMRCHALTIDEIHELEEDFRRSVQIALRSGADCVGIHAYGGYLTDQFLTRRWNTRTDAYGGSLENRARFLTELIAICKEEGGADFPVIVKFTPDHYMDGEGYRAIDEGIELAKLIVAAGADALHVDAGCHENWPNAMPPAGMQQMTLQSRSAKIIRSVVDVPVMTHGRFGDVDKAEAALRDGVCDIAVIGRGLLADPDLPNKARMGKADEINQCLRCYTCFSQLITTGQYGCAINPTTGRELECKYDTPPVHKRNVVVVGGGIGGMEAALIAAERGHKVTVIEKAGRLGGVLLIEEDVSFKAKLKLYIETQARKVMKNENITVMLSTEATPELVSSLDPDAVIAALGSRPAVPTYLPGYDKANVMPAEYAYTHVNEVGNKVVVIGGGLVGAELALHLASCGKQVTIMHRHEQVKCGANGLHGQAISEQIRIHKVGTAFNTSPVEITDDGVIGKNAEGEKLYEADTVIYAVGQRPLADEAEQFRFCAPEFYTIGDCVTPATIYQATSQAFYAARDIGRL